MKAIVQTRYGSPDVLQLKDADKPVVKADEVLVRVRAVAVNIGDWHLLRGMPYVVRLVAGLRRPRREIPGLDIAGQVQAVGANVPQFRPGDEVFGWCKGAFAEYACATASNLLPKPSNLTLEQSVAVGDSAFTALAAVRDQGRVQPGQRVLINGASGGVGTFAVQIAKAFGADVTGVCSTANLDMVRSIGADRRRATEAALADRAHAVDLTAHPHPNHNPKEPNMNTYVILRRDGWRTADDLSRAAERSKTIGEDMPDEIRWIRSYVTQEPSGALGTVCIYQATSPEASRRHAGAADLPATEIIQVADTVLVRPDPIGAPA